MIKYRDHRGGLSESMATTIEVSTVEEIITHLNGFWNQWGKHVEEIEFHYVGYDHRIGWNTFYVMQRLRGEKEFTVAGMSNGSIYQIKQPKDMKHADYVSNLVDDTVIILDLNLGNISVTNDMEYVLTEVNKRYVDITKLNVYYYDSNLLFSAVYPVWDNDKCINVKFNKND